MTTGPEFIWASALAPTPGHAHAAIVPPRSRLVMLAGACPLDPDGCLVTSRSSVVDAIAEQARACIDNLEVALTAAGATLDDLVSTRVLVASADSDILALAWRAVRLALNSAVPPSTLLGVTALGYPGQLVEVEAVAAIPATAPAPPLGDLSRSV